MANELELRQSLFDSEEELEQLVDLQNRVYQKRGIVFTKQYFHNRYVLNPSGKVISFNAFDGDKMIAHYACIPTRFVVNSRVANGILSLSTVTHQDYRGRGLFRTLAKMTYDKAREDGFEFVLGIANANSFPGFLKYFNFEFIDQLEVKVGYGTRIYPKEGVIFSGYYDDEIMKWRATCAFNVNYHKCSSSIESNYGKFARTFMGSFDKHLLENLSIQKSKFSILPKLYIGIGADIKSLYIPVPKFIKRSPFNLIFMDMTNGKLPRINKENIHFQLWDFDVV